MDDYNIASEQDAQFVFEPQTVKHNLIKRDLANDLNSPYATNYSQSMDFQGS